MKIIFQYIDKKNYVIFKKKKNNIYKLQQLNFSTQIC